MNSEDAVNAGIARDRRSLELGLTAFAAIVSAGAYVLTSLAEHADLPADLAFFFAIQLGLIGLAHLAIRRFASLANPLLLPLVAMLNGLGFVAIARLDRDLARIQSVWMATGVLALIAVLAGVRRVRMLERYRYTFALVGVLALLAPLAPGVGREISGARLWIKLGPLSFQPGEAAKVLLVLFLASYLVDKRELLATSTRRVGGVMIPDPKHFGPLLLAWGISMVVMIQERDLGSSLLFFTIFAVMLYIATARGVYLALGGGLFSFGAVAAYQVFAHVQIRVDTWLNPWPVSDRGGYQLIQALFAFGSGGFAGTGLGLGSPEKIPNAATDFIFVVIGEELGLLGSSAVVIVYLLLLGVGYGIAVRAEQPFLKLLAAGLTTILGVQTFIILGGVTRLVPLTGITLPFVSYGGSSLVANFVILGLLLRISDESSHSSLSATATTTATTGPNQLP